MNAVLEQIAPDIAQAIISQASARGLSVNEYLRQLLGLPNGHDAELAIAEAPEKTPPRKEDMLAVLQRSAERRKNMPVRGSAEEIRSGYSCLHSADGFYIALTEEPVKSGAAELLTFDKRLVNVAANNAPSVKVNLLTN